TGAFRHGASDWALYRTITMGVPGTAMQPTHLTTESAWQLVSYIRELARSSSESSQVEIGQQFSVEATYRDILTAEAASRGWLTYSGSYDGQRHSGLSEVNRETVNRLRVKWIFQFPRFMRYVQATPLVVNDIMYVTFPPNEVYALDARTGTQVWSY